MRSEHFVFGNLNVEKHKEASKSQRTESIIEQDSVILTESMTFEENPASSMVISDIMSTNRAMIPAPSLTRSLTTEMEKIQSENFIYGNFYNGGICNVGESSTPRMSSDNYINHESSYMHMKESHTLPVLVDNIEEICVSLERDEDSFDGISNLPQSGAAKKSERLLFDNFNIEQRISLSKFRTVPSETSEANVALIETMSFDENPETTMFISDILSMNRTMIPAPSMTRSLTIESEKIQSENFLFAHLHDNESLELGEPSTSCHTSGYYTETNLMNLIESQKERPTLADSIKQTYCSMEKEDNSFDGISDNAVELRPPSPERFLSGTSHHQNKIASSASMVSTAESRDSTIASIESMHFEKNPRKPIVISDIFSTNRVMVPAPSLTSSVMTERESIQSENFLFGQFHHGGISDAAESSTIVTPRMQNISEEKFGFNERRPSLQLLSDSIPESRVDQYAEEDSLDHSFMDKDNHWSNGTSEQIQFYQSPTSRLSISDVISTQHWSHRGPSQSSEFRTSTTTPRTEHLLFGNHFDRGDVHPSERSTIILTDPYSIDTENLRISEKRPEPRMISDVMTMQSSYNHVEDDSLGISDHYDGVESYEKFEHDFLNITLFDPCDMSSSDMMELMRFSQSPTTPLSISDVLLTQKWSHKVDASATYSPSEGHPTTEHFLFGNVHMNELMDFHDRSTTILSEPYGESPTSYQTRMVSCNMTSKYDNFEASRDSFDSVTLSDQKISSEKLELEYEQRILNDMPQVIQRTMTPRTRSNRAESITLTPLKMTPHISSEQFHFANMEDASNYVAQDQSIILSDAITSNNQFCTYYERNPSERIEFADIEFVVPSIHDAISTDQQSNPNNLSSANSVISPTSTAVSENFHFATMEGRSTQFESDHTIANLSDPITFEEGFHIDNKRPQPQQRLKSSDIESLPPSIHDAISTDQWTHHDLSSRVTISRNSALSSENFQFATMGDGIIQIPDHSITIQSEPIESHEEFNIVSEKRELDGSLKFSDIDFVPPSMNDILSTKQWSHHDDSTSVTMSPIETSTIPSEYIHFANMEGGVSRMARNSSIALSSLEDSTVAEEDFLIRERKYMVGKLQSEHQLNHLVEDSFDRSPREQMSHRSRRSTERMLFGQMRGNHYISSDFEAAHSAQSSPISSDNFVFGNHNSSTNRYRALSTPRFREKSSAVSSENLSFHDRRGSLPILHDTMQGITQDDSLSVESESFEPLDLIFHEMHAIASNCSKLMVEADTDESESTVETISHNDEEMSFFDAPSRAISTEPSAAKEVHEKMDTGDEFVTGLTSSLAESRSIQVQDEQNHLASMGSKIRKEVDVTSISSYARTSDMVSQENMSLDDVKGTLVLVDDMTTEEVGVPGMSFSRVVTTESGTCITEEALMGESKLSQIEADADTSTIQNITPETLQHPLPSTSDENFSLNQRKQDLVYTMKTEEAFASGISSSQKTSTSSVATSEVAVLGSMKSKFAKTNTSSDSSETTANTMRSEEVFMHPEMNIPSDILDSMKTEEVLVLRSLSSSYLSTSPKNMSSARNIFGSLKSKTGFSVDYSTEASAKSFPISSEQFPLSKIDAPREMIDIMETDEILNMRSSTMLENSKSSDLYPASMNDSTSTTPHRSDSIISEENFKVRGRGRIQERMSSKEISLEAISNVSEATSKKLLLGSMHSFRHAIVDPSSQDLISSEKMSEKASLNLANNIISDAMKAEEALASPTSSVRSSTVKLEDSMSAQRDVTVRESMVVVDSLKGDSMSAIHYQKPVEDETSPEEDSSEDWIAEEKLIFEQKKILFDSMDPETYTGKGSFSSNRRYLARTMSDSFDIVSELTLISSAKAETKTEGDESTELSSSCNQKTLAESNTWFSEGRVNPERYASMQTTEVSF